MLIWCSYCQQFLGEAPPYDQFTVTHGVCSACESGALELTESDLVHVLTLRGIQEQLAEAGRYGDLGAAEKIIEDAGRANVAGADVLIGVIAPMLYQIGEDWRCDIVTVAQEHRFTAFCERVYKLVAAKVAGGMAASPRQAAHGAVLLMNAPGNCHTLAIRILALWLARQGVAARVVDGSPDIGGLIALISRIQPAVVLVSIALAEQADGIIAIAARIAALPERTRPKVVVGGYAVKLGLVSAIPGASLMADISSLADFAGLKTG
jgi:methanogenic corrinoid protein MtbC1